MDKIIVFNNIITIISFVTNIAFIIPLCKKIYDYIFKKRYIRKTLDFTNREVVQIFFSIRELKNSIGYTNVYVTYDTLKAINNTIKLLTLANYKYNLIETEMDVRNEINIGSFLTNKRVNSYFTNFFSDFKYFVDEKHLKLYEQYSIDTRMIGIEHNKFGYQIGDVFLEIDDKICDYAFLIKLVKSDFKDSYEKTVHILFGGSSMATVKASEYLLLHTKQIYERFKNKHYFLAIQINRIDKSINNAIEIKDFTDQMFCQNS